MNKYTTLVLFSAILSLLSPLIGGAQSVNLGTPPVLNFPKQSFQGGAQTWDIDDDEEGVVWFANNAGLLEYDGAHWRIYPLPNATIVRSVRASAGRVYVGGQDEFGFFAPDQGGRLQYHSLIGFLPDSLRHFGDLWDIEVLEGQSAFFRCNHYLFKWDGARLKVEFIDYKGLSFLGKWHGGVLLQDSEKRFWVDYGSGFSSPANMPRFDHDIISGIIEWGRDSALVATIKAGIFLFDGKSFHPWETNCDAFLKQNRIMCAMSLPNGQLALGTALQGLITVDRNRRSQKHIGKKHGLQNNTVLSIAITRHGDAWLGLDNGVDFAALDAPFSRFFPDAEQQGTGYAIQHHRDLLYFGTNTGLFAIPWQPYYTLPQREQFHRVQNADGQVWGLNIIDGDLLMGHHEGAFEVNGLSARRMASPRGIWKYVSIEKDRALAGHYEGLAVFQKTGGLWQMQGKMASFRESSRLLGYAESVLWMAHPYHGIYRIIPDADRLQLNYDFLGAKQGLPSDLGNHLFQLGDQIFFTGAKGIYQYDASARIFLPDSSFVRFFGKDTPIHYLYQDKNGHIWFETEEETGVLLVDAGALEKKVIKLLIPELKPRLTRGFQCIFPVDPYNVFVATDQGFLHFDLEKYRNKVNIPLRLTLHEVRLVHDKDSLLYGGHAGSGPFQAIRLHHKHNSLTFSFASPDCPGGSQAIKYAYILEGGGSAKWSEWRSETEVGFNHLPAGEYVFSVKARNQYGVESPEQRFAFSVIPPWYAGPIAYIIYGLLFAGALLWTQMWQRRHFEKEKQSLEDQHRHREAEHQREVMRSEAVISQLQEEKFQAEIEHKTEELAAMAMHLVQKNTILQSMQESLERLKKKLTDAPEIEREIARIARMIETDANLDEDWAHFSQNFDQVHRDFLKRLGEKYPGLSPSDYKLCAYLRLNLSSKEISTLMNISLRGVETGRYRLRKRLNLGTEVNLTEFLMQF